MSLVETSQNSSMPVHAVPDDTRQFKDGLSEKINVGAQFLAPPKTRNFFFNFRF